MKITNKEGNNLYKMIKEVSKNYDLEFKIVMVDIDYNSIRNVSNNKRGGYLIVLSTIFSNM